MPVGLPTGSERWRAPVLLAFGCTVPAIPVALRSTRSLGDRLSEGAYKETQPSPALPGQGQPWQGHGDFRGGGEAACLLWDPSAFRWQNKAGFAGRTPQLSTSPSSASPPAQRLGPHRPPPHLCQEDGQGPTAHPVQPLPSPGGRPCHQQPSPCHLLREAPGGGRGAAGRAPGRRADSFRGLITPHLHTVPPSEIGPADAWSCWQGRRLTPRMQLMSFHESLRP